MAPETNVIPVDALQSIRQASTQHDVPRRTLYYWIQCGKLASFKVGETIYVRSDDVASLAKRSA